MIKNFLTVAIRNLLKNKFQSFQNIICLAIGMASLLIVLCYIKFEFSYDKFNINADRVFRVENDVTFADGRSSAGGTYQPGPLGPALKANFPEIIDYTRIYSSENPVVFSYGENKFMVNEGEVHWVDAPFLAIFDCLLLKGDKKNALAEPNTIVFTESIAERLFGKVDPIGKTIIVDKDIYRVTGICADPPLNTHFHYKYLLSYSTLGKNNRAWAEESWTSGSFYVYVILNKGSNAVALEKKMINIYNTYLIDKYSGAKKFDFKLRSITNIHFDDNGRQLEPTADLKYIRYLFIVAVFILLISIINSINFSTSISIQRAKEVGIRKVFGGRKSQIIYQFMGESLLLNLIAIFIALIVFMLSPLVMKNILPIYNFSPFEIIKEGWMWLLFITLLVVSVILSGLYPSFILSSYKPISVLKGKFSASPRGMLIRKCLIVFQYAIAIAFIPGIITVKKQLNYMQKEDSASRGNQILIVNGPRISPVTALSFFKMELLKNNKIYSLAFSTNAVGQVPSEIGSIKRLEDVSLSYTEANGIALLSSDTSFLNVNSIKLLAGRNFVESDDDAIILTEIVSKGLRFVKPEDAIDKFVSVAGKDRPLKIIGVFSDYHMAKMPKGSAPVGILLNNNAFNYISIYLDPTQMKTTVTEIKELWDKAFPKDPFEYCFLDDVFNQHYIFEKQLLNFVTFFTIIIIAIVCVGLWSLSSLAVSSRTKEIGIRKVLNAATLDIYLLFFNYFIFLILISSVISLPIGYYFFKNWLHNYMLKINIGAWFFIIPIFAILVITVIAIGYNIFKATRNNPANSLKIE